MLTRQFSRSIELDSRNSRVDIIRNELSILAVCRNIYPHGNAEVLETLLGQAGRREGVSERWSGQVISTDQWRRSKDWWAMLWRRTLLKWGSCENRIWMVSGWQSSIFKRKQEAHVTTSTDCTCIMVVQRLYVAERDHRCSCCLFIDVAKAMRFMLQWMELHCAYADGALEVRTFWERGVLREF